MPNYLCLYDGNTFSENWQECEREKICEDVESKTFKITAYKPKMDDEDYLDNWVDKLDLMCLSDA